MRSALRCVGAASLPLRRHLSATLAVPSGAPSPDLPPSTENSQPKLTGGDKLVPPVDATSDTALSPTLKKRRGKPRVYVRGRPLVSARVWNRPLAQGVLPVYDEALKIIRQDSAALKVRAYALGGDICAAKKAGLDKRDEEALSSMKTQTEKLELESEMNLPRVRWAVANGMVDMSKPVHRHLVEQKWRKEGALDLLMERIHQMHVIPDVLPDLRPSVDLRVAYRKISVHLQPGTRRKHAYVEPGIFLLPEQTRQPPRLYTTVFHTDRRLYTLIMLDPDVPDEARSGYQTYLHWLQPNIELSALVPNGQIPNLNTHTLYVPPHPQKGTKYHRYTILLLPQDSHADPISPAVVPDEERLGFNVRAFMGRYGLDGAVGGGAHMWRELWSQDVSKIYKEVLRQDEPIFGRIPKADPYEEVKRQKRYI